MTLTVYKFIQDGGQYKRSVSVGDDFEALLDILEDTEEVEEQCAGLHSSVGGAPEAMAGWNSVEALTIFSDQNVQLLKLRLQL